MYKVKLCLSLSDSFGLDGADQIRLFKEIGFDGFFSLYTPRIPEYKKLADELGMIYQSVHAPFVDVHHLWQKSDKTEVALKEQLDCVRACAENGINIMVCHAIIGFDRHSPCEMGIELFRKVVEEGARLGVKIAFENTEGSEYLEALMNAFKDYDNVGFCLDTGHELCYNRGEDMLKLYGDRLIATHINDNLGVRSYEGVITYLDDLHLLPYDGIGDFDKLGERLAKVGFEGPLTFELTRANKPGRKNLDKYNKISTEEYLYEAYARACRVGWFFSKAVNERNT